MAEPSPGRPGGSSGSPRSATGASFVVNDKSLKDLSKTWQGLTKDVLAFNKALLDLKTGEQTVDAISRKLAALGVGSNSGGSGTGRPAGGRAPGMPDIPSQGTPSSGGTGAPNGGSGQPGRPSSGGGGGGDDRGFNWAKAGRYGAGAAAVGAIGYMQGRMGTISDSDLFFNQSAQARGYSRDNLNAARSALVNAGGYQSSADMIGGGQTLTGALGSAVGSARMQPILQNVANNAALRPNAGIQGSAAAAASLYAPQTSFRLQSIGAGSSFGAGGAPKTPSAIYAAIVKAVYRGRKPTVNMIAEGRQPGSNLQMSIQALGLSGDAAEEFYAFAIAQANLGGDAARTERALADANAGRNTADVRASGFKDSIRSRQNERGAAGARREQAIGEASKDSLQGGFSGLARVTDELTGGFKNLNRVLPLGGALGVAGSAGGIVTSALGAVGGIGGALFAGQALSGRFGRRRGRGGAGGGGGHGGGPGVEDFVPGGVQRVFVTNWPSCICPGGSGGGVEDAVEDLLGGGGGKGGKGAKAKASRALSKVKGALGLGAGAEEGAAGLGARAGLGGLLEQGAFLAAPYAIPAAVGLAAGLATNYGLRKAAHAGWLPGVASDKEIKERNRYADDNRLTDALKSLSKPFDFMSVPGFRGEYTATAEPMVKQAIRTRKEGDTTAAVNAINRLKKKYMPDAEQLAGSQGKLVTGNAFIGHTYGKGVGMAGGGVVPGNHDNDTVPLRGTPGEVMVPKSVVNRHGGPAKLMERLGFRGGSSGGGYAEGGEVKANPSAWGNPDARDFKAKNITSVAAGGFSFEVNKAAAGKFQGFVNALVAAGYKAKSISGYVNRAIAGSSKKSNHAWGAAIDIDPFALGNGFDTGQDSKIGSGFKGNAFMAQLAHQFGLGWGGEWKSKRDWMHFEVQGGPSSASYKGGVSGVVPTADPAGSPVTANSGGSGANYARATAPGLFQTQADALASLAGGFGTPAVKSNSGNLMAANRSTTAGQKVTPTLGAEGAPSGNVGSWVKSALGILHMDFDKFGPGIAHLIQHESGGNPRAVNNWDSNAKAGHPSKGLMQTIDSTFARWSLPGHKDIFNPVDNIIAGTRYAVDRYGESMLAGGGRKGKNGGYVGYRKGSWDTDNEVAQLHEGEMVLPRGTASKVRDMVRNYGVQRGGAPSAAASISGSSGRGGVVVHLTAPVTLAGAATQQHAQDFVHKVMKTIEQDKTLQMMGEG